MIFHQRTRDFEGDAAPWLVTFGDLLALLLTFMVMLFATQELDVGKWQPLVDTLAQRDMPPAEAPTETPARAELNAEGTVERLALDLRYLDLVLRDKVATDPALAGVVIHALEDRIVIAVPADFLFAPGQSALRDEGRRTIYRLAVFFANLPNRVEVVGHTDPSPVSNDRYASNWELSVARAAAVARELRQSGYAAPVTAFGFGDSRFGDIPPEIAPERRQALARRVDIVVRTVRGSR